MYLGDEDDPLIELLERVHARVLESIKHVADGDEGKKTLDEVSKVLEALATAESEVLYPALSGISLPPETERFLEDCRDHRSAQLLALGALARSLKKPTLRKLRAVELTNLIYVDAKQHREQLLPVLRSRFARARYSALARAFAVRLGPPAEPTPELFEVTARRAGSTNRRPHS